MRRLKVWQKLTLGLVGVALAFEGGMVLKEALKSVVPEGQPCAGGRLLVGKNPWGVVVGSTGFDRIIFDTPALTLVAPFMENNHQILPRNTWTSGAVTGLGGRIAGRQFRIQLQDKNTYCVWGREVYYKR